MNKSERRALEAQANALLVKDGKVKSVVMGEVFNSPLGNMPSSVDCESKKLWNGEEMLAKAVNCSSSFSIGWAEAIELADFYESVEGRALMASERAIRAKMLYGKHSVRDEERRFKKLLKNEGKLNAVQSKELARMKSYRSIVKCEIVAAEFEHSYSYAANRNHFSYSSHRGGNICV